MGEKLIHRQYKDRLFRMAFREKRHLLALYNAINDSDYEDPEELEIMTLEDVIYMGMKNDASFVMDDILNLWEHQSSFNPNMPVRALSYFAKLYQNYISQHRINVYSSRLQKLPFPQYVVFYNGVRSEPDRMELKLSDAFYHRENMANDRQPCLEVRAVMLNINWGHNRELMDQCQRLREYSQCIATIREYETMISNREEAVSRAVDQCIADGVLADILAKNKAEVIAMFLTEYDEQAQRELDREEAREEGLAEGLEEGLAKGLAEGLAKGLAKGMAKGEALSLIRVVKKKVLKGISAGDTAEMLEESPELIQRIYDVILKHSDWTEDEVYEREKDHIF